MNKMNKWLKIAIIVVIALFVLSLTKDLIIRISVEKGIEMVTGLKMRIGSMHVGILSTSVKIRDLKVFNPPQFKDRLMVDMPEIYVDYDLPAIMGGLIHLTEVRLNLRQFTVVKNEKGELNLNSLKVVTAKKKGVAPESDTEKKAPNIKIDVLDLKIGKAVYKDYTVPGGPSIKEYNVNIAERYTNITNPYSLVSIIVVRALSNTAISNLANFDIGGLRNSVSGALSQAQNIAGQATDAAQKALQSTQGTQETVKKTSETVQKAAGALGDLFKDATQ